MKLREAKHPEVSDIEPDVSSKMQQLIRMSLLASYLILSVAVNKEDQQIPHYGDTQSSELESQENVHGADSYSDKQNKYYYDGDGTTYFKYISSQLSERYFDVNEQKKIFYSDTSNVNKFEYNPINEKLNQTWWENESHKTPRREDNLSFDGDGADPVSVEFRGFKTAFDIAEALGAVDLLKIRENNLVKPLARVVRWFNSKFEPETHIGYWKVPLSKEDNFTKRTHHSQPNAQQNGQLHQTYTSQPA
uniref:Uncharacterized protein n=1 Tax=Timema cristinae TaxID=61476 RepID=A0A7R9CXF6_TIMCR|nr:unnamed protein product [Timema cristinae]